MRATRVLADSVRVCGSTLPGLEPMVAHSDRSFPRHTHDLFGIGVVDRGGQRSLSGRGVVEALRGDLITVNPGEVHDGSALQGQARAWRMLYLEPSLVHRSDGRTSGLELTRPVLRDALLLRLFERLFADAVQGCDALALEEGLLALLWQAPSNVVRACAPRAAVPLRMERARARIGDNCAGKHTLADLAQEAGLSRYQFLRGFTAAFGLPPHAWLQQCRVALARRLIARGSALADAAASAGFADQSHMTRAFVRFLGFTPGAYALARRC